MPDSSPRAYIVEDDDAVRESLQLLLEASGISVRTYPEGEAFLADYNPEMAGCLLLDIRMPKMDGLTLQQRLIEQHSILPIIFVTGHGDIPMAVEAIRLGALDFIQKPYRDTVLLEKIEEAMQLDAQSRFELQQTQQILQRIDQLTPRERDVLQQLIEGKTNKAIAAVLEISQRTVEIHRSRIMEKLEAKTLAHLFRMMMNSEQSTPLQALKQR